MNVFENKAIADDYDSFYKSPFGQKIDLIEKQAIANILPQPNSDPILELGCGTGHWSEFLSAKGFSIDGLDLSDVMLAIAQQKNIPRANLQKGDSSRLTYSNETFELVFSIAMLEFVPDVQQVINEIFRVLKPGGMVILGCLNLRSELGRTKDSDEVFRTARFFEKEELKRLLSAFREVEIRECAYLTSDFNLLDGTMETYPVEGAFLVVKALKNK